MGRSHRLLITTIPEQPLDAWQAALRRSRADVIANLSGCDKEADWPTLAITNGMEFRVHTAFGAASQTSTSPFYAHAGRGAVGFQIGGINHNGLFLAMPGGQNHHDLGKISLFHSTASSDCTRSCADHTP